MTQLQSKQNYHIQFLMKLPTKNFFGKITIWFVVSTQKMFTFKCCLAICQ